MNFICAANWKMNLSFKEAKAFLEDLKKNSVLAEHSKSVKNQINLKSSICIFPQAVHASLFQDVKNINWGAQDFYFENQGAFTGQNSPDIFKELGANMMLIGHSERRTLFHESNSDISKKIKKCFELNLIPMLCVGETFEQRKSNQTLEVIKSQLKGALSELNISDSDLDDTNKGFTKVEKDVFSKIIVAYEPVWAIGTGLTALPVDVKIVHDFIKNLVGDNVHVLYGGSVKPENAKELSMILSVNGFLIGGASLKLDSFLSIYNNSVKD